MRLDASRYVFSLKRWSQKPKAARVRSLEGAPCGRYYRLIAGFTGPFGPDCSRFLTKSHVDCHLEVSVRQLRSRYTTGVRGSEAAEIGAHLSCANWPRYAPPGTATRRWLKLSRKKAPQAGPLSLARENRRIIRSVPRQKPLERRLALFWGFPSVDPQGVYGPCRALCAGFPEQPAPGAFRPACPHWPGH